MVYTRMGTTSLIFGLNEVSYSGVYTIMGTTFIFFGGQMLHLYRGPNGLLYMHLWQLIVAHGALRGQSSILSIKLKILPM